MSLKVYMQNIFLCRFIIFKIICMILAEKCHYGIDHLKGEYFRSESHIPKTCVQVSNKKIEDFYNRI